MEQPAIPEVAWAADQQASEPSAERGGSRFRTGDGIQRTNSPWSEVPADGHPSTDGPRILPTDLRRVSPNLQILIES